MNWILLKKIAQMKIDRLIINIESWRVHHIINSYIFVKQWWASINHNQNEEQEVKVIEKSDMFFQIQMSS